MKVLDVSSLDAYLDQLEKSNHEKKESLNEIQRSINALVNLESTFTGEGADAIKSYFSSCHLPLITRLQEYFSSFDEKINTCKQAVSAFEPADHGKVRQDFLEGDILPPLLKNQNEIEQITSDANQVISSISSIVSIQQLDDSFVNRQIQNSKKFVKKVVRDLEEMDAKQATSINELKSELTFLNQYVVEIEGKIKSGQITVKDFSPNQVTTSYLHHLMVTGIKGKASSLDSAYASFTQSSVYNMIHNKNQVYDFLGLAYYPSTTASKGIEKDTDYLSGNTSKTGDFTFSAGAGKMENKWGGWDDFTSGKSQLGGSSTLTGIHSSIKHDTEILDSSFSQDIGKLEGEASIGGTSLLPVVKAGATVYSASADVKVDERYSDYAVVNKVGAKGEILKANAYAGVDNNSIGFGAKASVVEGEVSGLTPIPFTDYNIKGTIGGSAFGIGGEAKVGKETVIDLRFLLGVKLGISFEKDED